MLSPIQTKYGVRGQARYNIQCSSFECTVRRRGGGGGGEFVRVIASRPHRARERVHYSQFRRTNHQHTIVVVHGGPGRSTTIAYMRHTIKAFIAGGLSVVRVIV